MKTFVLLMALLDPSTGKSITTGSGVDGMTFNTLKACESYKQSMGYTNGSTKSNIRFTCTVKR